MTVGLDFFARQILGGLLQCSVPTCCQFVLAVAYLSVPEEGRFACIVPCTCHYIRTD